MGGLCLAVVELVGDMKKQAGAELCHFSPGGWSLFASSTELVGDKKK